MSVGGKLWRRRDNPSAPGDFLFAAKFNGSFPTHSRMLIAVHVQTVFEI